MEVSRIVDLAVSRLFCVWSQTETMPMTSDSILYHNGFLMVDYVSPWWLVANMNVWRAMKFHHRNEERLSLGTKDDLVHVTGSLKSRCIGKPTSRHALRGYPCMITINYRLENTLISRRVHTNPAISSDRHYCRTASNMSEDCPAYIICSGTWHVSPHNQIPQASSSSGLR